MSSARVELASKLKVTVVPECAFMNWSPSVVNASFNDDAANTVIEPDRLLDEPELPEGLPEDEHAATPPIVSADAISVADHRVNLRIIASRQTGLKPRQRR